MIISYHIITCNYNDRNTEVLILGQIRSCADGSQSTADRTHLLSFSSRRNKCVTSHVRATHRSDGSSVADLRYRGRVLIVTQLQVSSVWRGARQPVGSCERFKTKEWRQLATGWPRVVSISRPGYRLSWHVSVSRRIVRCKTCDSWWKCAADDKHEQGIKCEWKTILTIIVTVVDWRSNTCNLPHTQTLVIVKNR
jgi:hypothetical protein